MIGLNLTSNDTETETPTTTPMDAIDALNGRLESVGAIDSVNSVTATGETDNGLPVLSARIRVKADAGPVEMHEYNQMVAALNIEETNTSTREMPNPEEPLSGEAIRMMVIDLKYTANDEDCLFGDEN